MTQITQLSRYRFGIGYVYRHWTENGISQIPPELVPDHPKPEFRSDPNFYIRAWIKEPPYFKDIRLIYLKGNILTHIIIAKKELLLRLFCNLSQLCSSRYSISLVGASKIYCQTTISRNLNSHCFYLALVLLSSNAANFIYLFVIHLSDEFNP